MSVKKCYIFRLKYTANMWLYKYWSNSYINKFKEVEISQEKRNNKFLPLNKDEARQLWGLAGQLIQISSQTRPDVAYNACEVSAAITDATINDLIMAKKYMRKVKAENSSQKILDLDDLEQCTIICFSDNFLKLGFTSCKAK